MSKVPNKVTLFSNGMVDFVQRHEITKGTKPKLISIPVKKSHVGDLLASLTLTGSSRLLSPPSFRPSNDNENVLTLSTSSVLEDLITKLAGAHVTAITSTGPKSGVIVGMHSETHSVNESVVDDKYLILSEDDAPGSMIQVKLNSLHKLVFTDPSIQAEIQKALKRVVERVKPESTFVDLSVSSDKDAEVVLQYTVPVSAWKISYRMSAGSDGSADLKAMAIVDNGTDQDWNEVLLAVVTGSPATFATNISESRVPERQMVNVFDKAVAPVQTAVMRGNMKRNKSLQAAPLMAMACSLESVPSGSYEGMSCDALAQDMMEPEATIQEVGDFSVYTVSEPLTIAANTSAIVPVMNEKISSQVVLHYSQKEAKAYRSLRIKNSTKQTLRRGVCTYFDQNIWSGSFMIPNTKPNEERILPFALETGVSVNHATENKPTQMTRIGLQSGVYVTEQRSEIVNKYEITNVKDEAFEFYIDYQQSYNSKNTVIATVNGTRTRLADIKPIKVSDGVHRFLFKLNAEEVLTLKVVETVVQKNSQTIAGNADYYISTLFSTDKYFSDSPETTKLMAVVSERQKYLQQIQESHNEQARLKADSEELRKNMVQNASAKLMDKWSNQLDENVESSKVEVKKVRELEKKAQEANDKLDAMLTKMVIEWVEQPKKK